MDRTQPPFLQSMRKALFPKVTELKLDNGIPVYLVPFGSQEIVEIRVNSRGGKCFELTPGSSGMTAKMLSEGTKDLSAFQFAQKLDEYGAFMQSESGYEFAGLALTCLEKHLDNTVPLIRSALLSPAFPKADFEKLKKRTLQHLEVEAKRTSYVARQEFARGIFGNSHPYGNPVTKEVVANITLDQLLGFHARAYAPANFNIVVSGRFNQDRLLALLNREFGSKSLIGPNDFIPLESSSATTEAEPARSGYELYSIPDSMQATLRVGHRSFSRSHPDYYPMQVLSTIFGGYFGSRLMSNIREDKGYTYGIYSGWIGLKYNGMFIIQTDVGVEYVDATLKEIKFELEKLIQDGTDDGELSLVKNYMLGKTASAWETPSQIVEMVSSAIANGLTFASIDEKFDAIQAVTKEDILNLAQKYYRPEQLLEVVAGANIPKKA